MFYCNQGINWKEGVLGHGPVAAIKSSGGEALFIHTDVSMASDAENLIKATKSEFGNINIPFNVAGVPHRSMPVENLDESL